MTHKVYDSIALETEVVDASPHRQIQMLYEKAIQHILLSKRYIEEGVVASKWVSMTKAREIISYLRTILNYEDPQSKELSEKLEIIYSYIEAQLTHANMKNETAYLDRALHQLTQLKASWDAIEEKVNEKTIS